MSKSLPHNASGPPTWTWGSERSRNGGIDEIPVPGCSGRLLLCGKHHIGPDHLKVISTHTVTMVVCLTERAELDVRYPTYLSWLTAQARRADGSRAIGDQGCTAVWAPTPDLGTLPESEMRRLVTEVDNHLRDAGTVLIHCAAGIGRSGTLAVAVLLRHGMNLADACAHVAAHRPLAGPETGPQQALLTDLAGDRPASDFQRVISSE